jgi:hypothetical protein
MILTQRQLDVLNHVVVDGQAWADSAEEDSMLAKVARWEGDYDASVLAGSYRNRAERDLDALPPPYVKTWKDKRKEPIAQGGYGTIAEQLEMIGEQGIGVFQAHIQTVKTNNPKPL